MKPRVLVLAVFTAALVAACAVTGSHPSATTESPVLEQTDRPVSQLTPGDVDSDAATIDPATGLPLTCTAGSAGRDTRRQVGAAEKRIIARNYGLDAGARVAEFDHLVAYWAGGRSDTRNVWPQLRAADKARKDALEDRYFRAVCVTRTMRLADAQARLKEYWLYW